MWVGRWGVFKSFMFLVVLVLTPLQLLWEESKPSLPFTYLLLRTDSCCSLTQRKGVQPTLPVPLGSSLLHTPLSPPYPLYPIAKEEQKSLLLPGSGLRSFCHPDRIYQLHLPEGTDLCSFGLIYIKLVFFFYVVFPCWQPAATGIAKATVDVLEQASEVINKMASYFA